MLDAVLVRRLGTAWHVDCRIGHHDFFLHLRMQLLYFGRMTADMAQGQEFAKTKNT